MSYQKNKKLFPFFGNSRFRYVFFCSFWWFLFSLWQR